MMRGGYRRLLLHPYRRRVVTLRLSGCDLATLRDRTYFGPAPFRHRDR